MVGYVLDILPVGGVYCVYTLSTGSISNLYHIETVNYNLICVNYSVHHASFVQTIIVQLLHNKESRAHKNGRLE